MRQERGMTIGTANKSNDGITSKRLLNDEEASLVLDAVKYRPSIEEDGEPLGEISVSIPAFWKLLVKHAPGLWDREKQERLDTTEVGRRTGWRGLLEKKYQIYGNSRVN